jgi:hypothetical protein
MNDKPDKSPPPSLRSLFFYYLTQDSKTHDARRKEFNQAIFDEEKGFACYNNTDLEMVMEKFDKAHKEYQKIKAVHKKLWS